MGLGRHDKNPLRPPPSMLHHQIVAPGYPATGQTPAIYGEQYRNGRRIIGNPGMQPPDCKE